MRGMIAPMQTILVSTHHDPDGRMVTQTLRVMPKLRELFSEVSVFLTPQTLPKGEHALVAAGAVVSRAEPLLPVGHLHLGLWRRLALSAAVATAPSASLYLFCDLDRALHWAEFYPDELREALGFAKKFDCTVFGRTTRAFASHPRAQRDTEAIANHGFALASGLPYDVMTAARAFAPAAAQLVVSSCQDDTVGSDCSWPLLCRKHGMTLGYLETEGMEFETLDRFDDEVAALGGPQAWLDRFDADPRQWALRLELARAEIASAIAYT